MTQSYNNESELAAAKISVKADGLDDVRKMFEDVRKELDRLDDSVAKLNGSGGGGDGSGGDSGGGSSSPAGGGKSTGIFGIVSGFRSAARALTGLFAVREVTNFAEQVNELNIRLTETRGRLSDISEALKVVDVGRAALRGAVADATGVPEIALRAQSQGPAQEAVRAAYLSVAGQQLEERNRVEAQIRLARAVSAGASDLFPNLFPGQIEQRMIESQMNVSALLFQKANQDAVQADAISMSTQLRNISSGQKR